MENTYWQVSAFELKPHSTQIAFAVNSETCNIVVSSSGHPTIKRYLGNNFCGGGGWIWLDKEKITCNSGCLGYVLPNVKKSVVAALCNYFRKELRVIDNW
jgi:hypothetical protein